MFVTYLRRELRRRMRQAIFIALGLALGIGLVITVTAASAGVSGQPGNRPALPVRGGHRRHGHPAADRGLGRRRPGSASAAAPGSKPPAGTSFSRSVLTSGGLGTLTSSESRR